MAKLDHPFIVKYHGSFVEDDTLTIAMDYCEGGDLSFLIKKQLGRSIKEERVWAIFVQIASALQFLHKKKILHRDLKTLNVFLTKDGQVRLGDLGVAKMLAS
jgi:serine/threonine protein kinase